MMKNKRISKITMLTALFVAGIVNAQEFYTCVPKKSWWMDTMGESIKRNVPTESSLKNIIKDSVPSASDIANAVKGAIPTPTPTPQQPSSGWKLVKRLPRYFDINLTFGRYKIKSGKDGIEFEALDGQRLYTNNCKNNRGSCILISGHGSIDSLLRIESDVIELYKYE